MSLFKIREFWTTQSEDDEYFDQNSLITTTLNSDSDFIISGSQSGVLRIFKPSSELTENDGIIGYSATDLLIEKILNVPILQIGCGRLVSGSQNLQIAVLHPRLLSIYTLKSKEGATEHGTQHYLELLYEHSLRRSSANFVIGQFGGSQNRDFICVQSLDGMLSFFEQESFTFSCFVPDFLLPGPIAYVKKTDHFVTSSSSWCIVAYKYKLLSEAGEKSEEKVNSSVKIDCDWSFNLGEAVIDIYVIDDFINKEAWIMLLGERNLYCLKYNGKLKFMKRLDYSPICFHTYVLDMKISNSNTEKELGINLLVNPDLKLSTFESNLKDIENQQMCVISIEILPQIPFEEVQISVAVLRPLKASPQVKFYNNLNEKTSFTCYVFLDAAFEIPSLSMEVSATVITNLGLPKTICKSTMLPMKLVLDSCQAQKESQHKITLNINHSPVSLATLFPGELSE
ncbi:hypothetical protein NQ314_006502 [Rhamnusium bicolor]|uniref:Protein PTHB1 n=1 Tax=Rhamnusium bicolor TaxID=1586634 RepID=A0AAV8Z1N8_9CUCU|nr:hypothetical protein NQ314_006502 [Rhamnusium bicolor]